jgi:glycosyltransferase involved in cell wall biosynthesis
VIKVLHILDSLNRGGAEVMELDVYRNANVNGLNLVFVATGGGDLEKDFRQSGVDFVRLQRKLPVDLSLAGELRRLIADRQIDVVHSHQPVEALHLLLATRGSTIKRVLTLHGVYPGARNDLALRFVLPRLDARVVVSEEVRRAAGAKGYDTKAIFCVVRNGVDPARLATSESTLRDELGLAPDALLFGMVGNFTPVAQKDQLTVCRALPRVFANVAPAHFVFVGARSEVAPHLFDECVAFCQEAGIADRVSFLGRRSDIANVLAGLDLFVLSSQREGSPISVIEAMMSAVPALLSDIAPLKEVSDDGEFAVLFRSGDADDLATQLLRLAVDREHRLRLAASARQWALSQFSIEAHIANLLKLYDSLDTKTTS